MRAVCFVPLFLALGCRTAAPTPVPDPDTDTDTDADTDVECEPAAAPWVPVCDDVTQEDPVPGCGITVSSVWPQDGAVGVNARARLSWTFSEVDPSAAVTVSTGGAPVAGSPCWQGETLYWDAEAPLAPSTPYDAELEGCVSLSTSFTTSETGPPVADPAALVGRVWSVDLAAGQWVQPVGIGPLLIQQLDTRLLLTVTGVSNTLQMRIAHADGVTQDECSPTGSGCSATELNPHFDVTIPSLDFQFDGCDTELSGITVSGDFTPDGTGIEGVRFRGWLDTRPMVPCVEPGAAADAFCLLVEPFGLRCEPCADGGEFCLPLFVEDPDVVLRAGAVVVERTDADIAADPQCP